MNKTDFAKHSTCYDSAQELIGREKRDRPLIMGHRAGPALVAAIGLLPVKDAALATGIASIIADVLIGHRTGQATSYSRRKEAYTGLNQYHPAMTHRVVTTAMDHLSGIGLIEVEAGRSWAKGGRGKQSRAWAADLLIDLAGSNPAISPNQGPALVMKDSSKDLIPYRETERTIAMSRDVRAQNEILASADVRLDALDVEWVENGFVTVPGLAKGNGTIGSDIIIRSDQTALTRIANNSSWRQGTRHYGHFAQGLNKTRRQQLTIGGGPVELLDYGAAHIALLYAKAGLVIGGDPYEVEGFPRGEVKLALLILINAANRHQAIAAMGHKLAGIDGVPTGPDHRVRARKLFAAVEEKHQVIAQSFCTGAGTGLQHDEAEIIRAVMKAAAKQGIVTIPIHDELIAKAGREADQVRDLMVEKWVSACGAFPLI